MFLLYIYKYTENIAVEVKLKPKWINTKVEQTE